MFSGTVRKGFSKARRSCNLVVAALQARFFLSELAEGVCYARPLNGTWLIPFFLTKILELTFLALAQLRGTAQVWNPLGISNSWEKVDCCLSYDSFLALRSKAIVRGFLATNACSGVFNIPMPCMAFVACHMTAFSLTLRSKAIVQPSSLRIICSRIFNLRRVVLLRYCSRCVW